MKRKRKVEPKLINYKPLDTTSSLNDYFMCGCGRRYTVKQNLVKHVADCNGLSSPVVCHWCKLEFKNKGNLVTHAFYMHGDKNLKKPKYPQGHTKYQIEHKCEACDISFTKRWNLKYHIRRSHFNLCPKVPHAEAKKVNQVWFEKVLNSNLVVEIKKTGLNTLVLKPIPPNAGIKIHDNSKIVDLRTQYPIGRSQADEICTICQKIYRRVDLQKHMNERHFNLTKHTCNNCNKSFKRSYAYLQHVCHKVRFLGTRRKLKVNGVKHNMSSSIRITSVESLKPVEID